MDWYRKHSLRIVIKGVHIMADRENEKKYSAETKGYTDKIYEVRFMPVLERSAVSYTHLTLPTNSRV